MSSIKNSQNGLKEWALRAEMEEVLTFICHLKLNFVDTESELKGLPCGEIVMVPQQATVGDLKQAAEAALRDTYCIAERLVVTEIAELMGASDDDILLGLIQSGVIQSGVELSVRGIGIDLCTPLKYQEGSYNWKVRCGCGAGDDDGERMVACDMCEVWQHTRCCGFDDSETVPRLCVCSGCWDSLVPPRIESGSSVDCAESADDFLISTEPTQLLVYGYGCY